MKQEQICDAFIIPITEENQDFIYGCTCCGADIDERILADGFEFNGPNDPIWTLAASLHRHDCQMILTRAWSEPEGPTAPLPDRFQAYTSDGHWATSPCWLTQEEFDLQKAHLLKITDGVVDIYKGDPCTHLLGCPHCAANDR